MNRRRQRSPCAALTPPAPLTAAHLLGAFASGAPSLDDWLRRRALANQIAGASRTYVVCVGDIVAGYYSLAAGAVARHDAPGSARRTMPDPIPVVVLGRLAVDRRYQGQGIGAALLRDAIVRVLNAADSIGVRALLVHAISEDAARFSKAAGFAEFPASPLILCLPLETARRAIAGT